MMNRKFLCHVGGLAFLLSAVNGFPAFAQTAQQLAHAGLQAMGGEAKLRALHSVHLEISGHRNLLEQSERPEGPYILDYQRGEEWRDLDHHRWRQSSEDNVATQPKFGSTEWVADGVAVRKFGEQSGPGNGQQIAQAEEALALSPERILITALDAPDLRRGADLTLQSVPHEQINFTWHEFPVRVFLNADTHLPTAVEWVSPYPYDVFWNIWGDVTTRVYYSFWWLQKPGIHFPLQADVVRNGLPDRAYTVTKVEFNAPMPDSNFDVPPKVKEAFQARGKRTIDDIPLGVPNQPAQELTKDIIFIPGSWNTTLIKQTDGIVVLEAPISSGYSGRVLEEAARRWPGVPVKAVISTSDSWPHIGGVREYVARGIPVYVLDRTVPLLRRELAASHHMRPDALAKSPKQPVFRAVSGKTVIGVGANRLEIYPIHGETSERQMMVYFPEHKLLYGSDPFQKLPDGSYFYPQTVSELADAVSREHLTVTRFFMMHVDPTPWTELENVLSSNQ